MTSRLDWQAEIRGHASRADVVLPEATLEEIAEHLEDIYAGAIRDGCTFEDAQARARVALEESTMDVLRRRVPASTTARSAREDAEVVARAAGGHRLNLIAALRLAASQLRLHPAFAATTILVLALGIGTSTTV